MEDTDGSRKGGEGPVTSLRVTVLIIICVIFIVLGWVKYNLYASRFPPVILSADEEQLLNSKLDILGGPSQKKRDVSKGQGNRTGTSLKPEPYTESGANRELTFNERELNSLITEDDPDMARNFAVDLSDGLVSIQLVIPVDEEIFLLGGKRLRINVGIILSYENDRPVVALKGISLGGIPMPNAWLGYIKGKNLVEEFGSEEGFWKLFAEGVKDIKVMEGYIRVVLKE